MNGIYCYHSAANRKTGRQSHDKYNIASTKIDKLPPGCVRVDTLKGRGVISNTHVSQQIWTSKLDPTWTLDLQANIDSLSNDIRWTLKYINIINVHDLLIRGSTIQAVSAGSYKDGAETAAWIFFIHMKDIG
jgi:hypothetical protein